jgi:hypothetical protein
MIEPLRNLRARLDALDKSLKANKNRQVHSRALRDSASQLVDQYFREVRKAASESGVPDDTLMTCDGAMQALLAATHQNSAVTTYRKQIRIIRNELTRLEVEGLHAVSAVVVTKTPNSTDARIVETLSKLLPSAALSYAQAMRDLSHDDRLSWRGPATDLREALRETLDHLAPDSDVKAAPGFKMEPNTSGPTMRQKVRYVLGKRGVSKSATQAPEDAAAAVDEAVGSFVRSVYTRSNISTHTPTSKVEVVRVRDLVRVTLCELLEIQDV